MPNLRTHARAFRECFLALSRGPARRRLPGCLLTPVNVVVLAPACAPRPPQSAPARLVFEKTPFDRTVFRGLMVGSTGVIFLCCAGVYNLATLSNKKGPRS